MNRPRNFLKWPLIAIASLALLLLALALAVPRLVDTQAVRSGISDLVARQTGGTFACGRILLAVFPSPGVRLEDAALEIPGAVRAQAASIRADAGFIPLLTGRLEIRRLRMRSAEVRVITPAGERDTRLEEGTQPAEGEQAPEALSRRAERFLSGMARAAPGITLEIEESRVEWVRNGRPPVVLEDIDLRLYGPPKDLRIRLACKSGLWDSLSMEASLDAAAMTGSARVKAERLSYGALRDAFFPDRPEPVSDAIVNLEADLSAAGPGRFRGSWSADLPQLTLNSPGEKVVLSVKNLDGSFEKTADGMTLVLSRLETADPPLSLAARAVTAGTSPRIRVEATIGEADLEPLRALVLKLAGRLPEVARITDIVRAGRAEDTTLRLQGDAPADLGKIDSLFLKGTLRGGIVAVEDFALELTAAQGEVTLAGGVLACRDVEAGLGNSRLSRGILNLGLAPGDDTFHLEADVHADLGELTPILEAALGDPAAIEEIRRITRLEGQARGRLVLGESAGDLGLRVDVSEIQASLAHRALPHAVQVQGGPLALDAARLDIGGLSARAGQSAIGRLTGTIGLAAPIPLSLRASGVQVNLEEVMAWLTRAGVPMVADGDIGALAGQVELADVTLSGPGIAPGQWDIAAEGTLSRVVIQSRLLPGALKVAQARVQAGKTGEVNQVSFSDARTAILDAEALASGRLAYTPQGLQSVQVDFSGRMDESAARYLSDLLHRPRIRRLRSPITVSDAALHWEKETISAKAALQIAAAPPLTLQLRHGPGLFEAEGRIAPPGGKPVDFAVGLAGDILRIAFAGDMDAALLDRFVTASDFPHGRIHGDFQARVLLAQPSNSTASGRLEISDIFFPVEGLVCLLLTAAAAPAAAVETMGCGRSTRRRSIPPSTST